MDQNIYWNFVEIAQDAYLQSQCAKLMDDYDIEIIDDVKDMDNQNDSCTQDGKFN